MPLLSELLPADFDTSKRRTYISHNNDTILLAGLNENEYKIIRIYLHDLLSQLRVINDQDTYDNLGEILDIFSMKLQLLKK
jgi:hypothetical protein